MTFQELQELQKLKLEVQSLKQEINVSRKEVKILKTTNKFNLQIIDDLEKGNYKEKYESSNNELKNINKQLQKLKDVEEKDYKGKYNSSIKEIEFLKKKVADLELALEIFKNASKIDSSNSSKPSSTNGLKIVIQNNRVKSNKKPGREKGHTVIPPKFNPNPTKLIKVKTSATCNCGGCVLPVKEVKRQVMGVKIITEITEYVGYIGKCECGKSHYPQFPKGINKPIQYNDSFKSLIIYLNTYCNVSDRVISELISFVTDNEINIAPATVLNAVKRFSEKSKVVLEDIKQAILMSPVINNDETPINVNGKQNSALGVFTENLSLIEAHPNRTMEEFIAMSILNVYTGVSCHDHNSIHKSFSLSIQAECNTHPIREAKGIHEIHKHNSINKWIDVMYLAKKRKEGAIADGKYSLRDKEIAEIKSDYLKSLSEWDEEYKKIIAGKNEKYFSKDRCLKNRLREFVDDHLRFLTDFRVPFTNNLAERGLRPLKTKLKIIGCFRTLSGAQDYCNAKSIIDTCKKQGLTIGKVMREIMSGHSKVFDFQRENKRLGVV